MFEFSLSSKEWTQPEYSLAKEFQDFIFHNHSSAYDEKRNRFIIYNNSELMMYFG